MQLGKATGIQVAFLIFAVFLLTAPFTRFVGSRLHLDGEWLDPLGRIAQLAFLALAIFVVEQLRPGLVAGQLRPIPAERRWETAIFTSAHVVVPFGVLGAIVLWHWMGTGPLAVERRFPTDAIHATGQWRAFSAPGLVHLFAAVVMAPLIEEIAFRGLLYRAWEQAWGWIPAMLASSAVFALFHPSFAGPFVGGILFVCLYRRAGTLVAPIIAHAAGNACAWYPLLGRHYFPDPALPAGDLGTWPLHLAVLCLLILLGPVYVFMARNPRPREAA